MGKKREARHHEKRLAQRWITTECGKKGYTEKAEAKHQARLLGARSPERYEDVRGMTAYRCEACKLWHVGHLPARVRLGDISRAEYYGGSSAVG